MTLGNRIKELLEEKQISQKQLAKGLNMAASTLNGYIKNYREPDFKTLGMLATYFSVSSDYLLGRSEYGSNSLNPNETELIRLFGLLTDEQQEYLIEQAKLYARHNTRKQETSSDTGLKEDV